MDQEQLKGQYGIFCDVWKLYRTYAGRELQDWEGIISEVDRITRKYNCDLCYALCHAVMEEFERTDEVNNRIRIV